MHESIALINLHSYLYLCISVRMCMNVFLCFYMYTIRACALLLCVRVCVCFSMVLDAGVSDNACVSLKMNT